MANDGIIGDEIPAGDAARREHNGNYLIVAYGDLSYKRGNESRT